ncbi:MAG: hypothetical protein U5N85_17765 [Arcicella sp.]|nr:hypothetical protein [Arcicella sp.]
MEKGIIAGDVCMNVVRRDTRSCVSTHVDGMNFTDGVDCVDCVETHDRVSVRGLHEFPRMA